MTLSIVDVLIQRDGMTCEQAVEALAAARERLEEGTSPELILEEEFGLEPDYIFDLLD